MAPAIARSSIVTMSSNTRRPFGKPASVPADQAERVRRGRRRDRHVQTQHVRERRARVVLEARDDARRDPCQQDRHEVCAVGLESGEVGEDARVQDGQQPRELGLLDVLREVAVGARLRAFQTSFLPSGTTTSLKSGLPSRETCAQGPTLAARCRHRAGWLSMMRTERRLAPPRCRARSSSFPRPSAASRRASTARSGSGSRSCGR